MEIKADKVKKTIETDNQRPLPQPGEFYRHFKGKFYQIKALAKDAGTLEMQVVYQALYGSFGVWVRPLSEFMSPVDRDKYPEAGQTWRFEKVLPEELTAAAEMNAAAPGIRSEASAEKISGESSTRLNKSAATSAADLSAEEQNEISAGRPVQTIKGKSADQTDSPEKMESVQIADQPDTPEKTEPVEEDSYTLDPLVEKFLDADNIADKLRILDALRPRVTDAMIDTMAIASGVEVAEGDVQNRLWDLRECLRTIERYEQTRDRFR